MKRSMTMNGAMKCFTVIESYSRFQAGSEYKNNNNIDYDNDNGDLFIYTLAWQLAKKCEHKVQKLFAEYSLSRSLLSCVYMRSDVSKRCV